MYLTGEIDDSQANFLKKALLLSSHISLIE